MLDFHRHPARVNASVRRLVQGFCRCSICPRVERNGSSLRAGRAVRAPPSHKTMQRNHSDQTPQSYQGIAVLFRPVKEWNMRQWKEPPRTITTQTKAPHQRGQPETYYRHPFVGVSLALMDVLHPYYLLSPLERYKSS